MNRMLLAAAATLALGATAANAKILVDQDAANVYAGYSIGGSDWTALTSELAAQDGGYVVGSIANAADLVGIDAIFITARSNYGPSTELSSTEIANLTAFLASGGRVAMIGDGVEFIYGAFTNSIVNFASGGTATPTFFVGGTATAIAGSELTAGVTSALMQGAATVNGGTALFAPNFATLWGDNVVTVLDVNVLTQNPSPVFRANLADWLGAANVSVVPEPASWAMMIGGFGLVGAAMRRRQRVAVRFG